MSSLSSTLHITNRSTTIALSGEDPFPISTPGLAANQICRIAFAIIGITLCWVPFRLLARNGEFVAVVFIVDVVITNVFTILNAAIWPTDDLNRWWDGVGYCDLQTYTLIPMQCLYASCIFATMRNLAQRLRLTRATNLTQRERRRQILVQSLIIFPVPIIQVALMWFVLSNRYVIGTVVGCFGIFNPNWFRIICFNFPASVYSVATIPYAYLTWKRFRDISKTTKVALAANTEASARSQRTKRRLYQMALSIIVPYVPLQLVFFVVNMRATLLQLVPYDYYAMHYVPNPYPWNAIYLLPSWTLDFETLNQPWIPILTTIPIVLFCGMTEEAIDIYRRFALRLGLGNCFPNLRDPHDPNRSRSTDGSGKSWWSSSKNRKPAVHEISSIQASTIRQSHLPDPHHQAVVTSSGPFVPPRHSSSSRQGPLIPPRSSSLQNGSWFGSSRLRYIPRPIKMPFISTLRSGIKMGRKGDSSSSVGSGNRASEKRIPLQPMKAESTPLQSLHTPASDGGKGTQKEPMFSESSGSIPGSEWSICGPGWPRPTAPHHHAERSRAVEEEDPFENAGNGFVKVKIIGGRK
ncbi:hypothetical protein SCAR479_04000 [Seiridium cardinale]|uniref:Pheromone receptor n=1 Tax=Seiridium cardinale TaxID=138064 RepID=A0ABR2XZ96_9PEZI